MSIPPKNSGKTIYIAIGVDDGAPAFSEIDKVITRQNLISIAHYAAQYGHRLALRDHPAITPMLEVLMEENPGNLLILPENADSDAVRALKPRVAFYIAGTHRTLSDYRALSAVRDVMHVPLPGTGGAAEKINAHMTHAERTALDGGSYQDIFGGTRIARAMMTINPPMPQRKGPTLQ